MRALTAIFWRLPWPIADSPPREIADRQFLSGKRRPAGAQEKGRTPTMGGVFDCSLYRRSRTLLWDRSHEPFHLISAFCTRRFRGIGFIDDYAKVSKARNLGLTAKKKIYFQVFVSLVVGVSLLVLTTHSAYSTQLMIHF